jgi:uncharacterized protein
LIDKSCVAPLMPTNILRQRARPAEKAPVRLQGKARLAVLAIGGIAIRLRLADTQTAERIWAALPLFSKAETWGDSIHFEIPVHTGRERNARLNVKPGDTCFWSEDDRVLIGFGPTPISMPGEIRLMRPCNIWAQALDDVTALRRITPGEKVALQAAG